MSTPITDPGRRSSYRERSFVPVSCYYGLGPYVLRDRRRLGALDRCFLGMLRLGEDAGRWERVGDAPFPFDHEWETYGCLLDGSFFAGYAVLHEDTILVSLRSTKGLFLTYDCSGGTWAEVTAQKRGHTSNFVPISGHGVYVKEEAEGSDDKKMMALSTLSVQTSYMPTDCAIITKIMKMYPVQNWCHLIN